MAFHGYGQLSRVAELGPEARTAGGLDAHGTSTSSYPPSRRWEKSMTRAFSNWPWRRLESRASWCGSRRWKFLKRVADPSAYEPVERLLTDKEVNMRVAAIATAASCGGARAVPKLVRMLKDASWESAGSGQGAGQNRRRSGGGRPLHGIA